MDMDEMAARIAALEAQVDRCEKALKIGRNQKPEKPRDPMKEALREARDKSNTAYFRYMRAKNRAMGIPEDTVESLLAKAEQYEAAAARLIAKAEAQEADQERMARVRARIGGPEDPNSAIRAHIFDILGEDPGAPKKGVSSEESS